MKYRSLTPIDKDLPEWRLLRKPRSFCMTFALCHHQRIWRQYPVTDTACVYPEKCVYKTEKPWWER